MFVHRSRCVHLGERQYAKNRLPKNKELGNTIYLRLFLFFFSLFFVRRFRFIELEISICSVQPAVWLHETIFFFFIVSKSLNFFPYRSARQNLIRLSALFMKLELLFLIFFFFKRVQLARVIRTKIRFFTRTRHKRGS